ncbi:MAG: hypothetical protein ACREXM_16450 [Gammaproteobacteria bacterium]
MERTTRQALVVAVALATPGALAATDAMLELLKVDPPRALARGRHQWKYWDFKNEIDFSEDEVSLKDVYIANTYFKPLGVDR